MNVEQIFEGKIWKSPLLFYSFPQDIYIWTGKKYTVGQAAKVLYEAGGTSIDYMRKFSFTERMKLMYHIKLRDTGRYGVELPARYIIPTGDDAKIAAFSLARYILESLEWDNR